MTLAEYSLLATTSLFVIVDPVAAVQFTLNALRELGWIAGAGL
jgi:hypothetical protein